MGILVANLPAFGLPEAAYFSPRAWGGTAPTDIAVWFATFVLIEGKMRAVFSFLFGASMLIVIDAAEARGENGALLHFRRMAALLLIGCAHLYLVWWGDILSHYALVGAFAYIFARLPVRWLVALGVALVALQIVLNALGLLVMIWSAAQATPDQAATWASYAAMFGVPPPRDLAAELVAMHGSWTTGVIWRWSHAASPFVFLPIAGAETLSAMVLGMAAYRTGFLTGVWPRASYRRWAFVSLGIALPGYAALGLTTMAHGFDQRWVFLDSIVATQPFRLLGMVGYAALVILLIRPGGRLTRRIAATGRAAFSNYLGTSLVMSFLFQGWGLGLFGTLSRAQLYLLVLPAWAIMTAWSLPWLTRYHHGPFEWAWRSLASLTLQRMKKGPASLT